MTARRSGTTRAPTTSPKRSEQPNATRNRNRHTNSWLASGKNDERRRTLATALAERTRYMTLLAENTFHPHNASALMRHCDAFGVQELHTVETLCKFSPNASIVRGTDKWVDVRRHASTGEAVAAKYYQQRGWLLLNHNYRTRLKATGSWPRRPTAKAARPKRSTSRAVPSRWSSAPSTPASPTRRWRRPTNTCASRCAGWSRASTSRPRRRS